MTELIARGRLPEPGSWHVYGSLMTDVERLLADLDRADRVSEAASDARPSTTASPAPAGPRLAAGGEGQRCA
jgi:hypothetical protein